MHLLSTKRTLKFNFTVDIIEFHKLHVCEKNMAYTIFIRN
jgi:hypothetical protein